ncbi:uncharacterized protein LOC116805555 [Drosophila grimshawi]|uniref:uncharacterized protein LOC116805555 n=1 Tax=Drosophila grimshawi TaxID=7222 RepID=UPI000C86F0F4|nr:uncharacterized protein LOC116805555 [Drosophila grimshawi]
MCNDCCCSQMRKCCQCQPQVEKLRSVDEYRWFQRCPIDVSPKCDAEGGAHQCECICRRNRHIIEALSCLFKCSIQYMLSVLFKLAYQIYQQPLKRYPRDRVWSVMRHVKAPYTELNDLEIYDSMYDRCGMPIDPLDKDNILKIVRMMFLISVLTFDQQKYLLHMLNRLNAHAHCPVEVEFLLRTLKSIELRQLVCSLRNQEALTQRLYTSRQCSDLCGLYTKVATVDKYAIARHRSRRDRIKNKRNVARSSHAESLAASSARQSAVIRQFCERKARPSSDMGGNHIYSHNMRHKQLSF